MPQFDTDPEIREANTVEINNDNSTEYKAPKKNHVSWTQIPYEVLTEVKELANATSMTGREYSLTMCKKPNKERLFVGNDFKGNQESTLALDCDKRFGKSMRVGSAHSHPDSTDTIGIVPSDSDLHETLADSLKHKHPMIDCVTAPRNQFINCYTPIGEVSKKKVSAYRKATNKAFETGRTAPYILDNMPEDFAVSLYDSDNGKRVDNPEPDAVVKSAFGRSNKSMRDRIRVMDRETFCRDIIDRMGQHDDDRHIDACKKELGRRSVLGWFDV